MNVAFRELQNRSSSSEIFLALISILFLSRKVMEPNLDLISLLSSNICISIKS